MSANTLTLEYFLKDNELEIAESGPAYYVHPRHKSSPDGHRKLLPQTAEVLLSNGVVVYICQEDQRVFQSPDSIVVHRRRLHKTQEEPKAKARRKTQSNARTELSEPTYGELKKQLDAALTRVGELDHSLRVRNDDYNGLLQELKEKGEADHSKCYEYVGMTTQDKKVAVVRDGTGKLYRAYPL